MMTETTVDTKVDTKAETVPNGLYWSKDEAEKAMAKHTFIRVSDSDKRSMRQITGAERVWSNPPTQDEIYITTFRISGKAEDVSRALSLAGYSQDQVDSALSSAITVKNYKKTHRKIFKSELENLKLYKTEEKERRANSQASWNTILKIAENIKEVHVVMKDRPKTPGKKGKGKTLVERFNEIHNHEGKIIDVSDMREDGTKVILKAKPKSERGRFVFMDGIAIMSRSEEKYVNALKMLFEADKFDSESDYQKAIKAISAKFAEKRRKGKA